MIINFYENALARLRERQAIFMERILSGSFDKLSDYKLMAGKLSGVEDSIEILQNLYSDTFDFNKKRESRNDRMDSQEMESD